VDLETFFTILYVIIDDWYKAEIMPYKSNMGRPPKLSDSEVLTLAVASQWRCGVPWQSERGFIRHIDAHFRHLFPNLVCGTVFNYRVRHLFGVLVQLQQALAEWLTDPCDLFECVDTVELPAYTTGHQLRQKSHWLWQSTQARGAHGHWFYGHFLLASVLPSGAMTGWLVATAYLNDRWILQRFLSLRCSYDEYTTPIDRLKPPVGYIGGLCAVGQTRSGIYLADKGFGGRDWVAYWQHDYDATVITAPQVHEKRPGWERQDSLWLAKHRQIIDTVFGILHQVFDIKRMKPHSYWGLLTQIACKTVGVNMGIFLNRLMGRPDLSHQTLIC
jgi:hypothetical protein